MNLESSELDPRELEQRLLQVTSRHGAEKLDAETAALRDGFLLLGKALDEASADVDERRILAALTETQPVVIRAVSETSQDKPGIAVTWILALAAAALVAIGLGIYAQRSPSVTPQIAQPSLPNSKTLPDASLQGETLLPESPQLAGQDSLQASSGDGLGWDDSLDDQFSTAQQLLGSAGRLSGSADAEFTVLYERIQAASSAVQDEAL